MNEAQKKPLQLQDSLAVRILICVLFPLIAFAVLLLSQGKSPLVAYQTILTSIFGSAYGFGEVIVRAAYLILTGLAASIPARVGLANAGGEGQMAVAALGTAVAGNIIDEQGKQFSDFFIAVFFLYGLRGNIKAVILEITAK